MAFAKYRPAPKSAPFREGQTVIAEAKFMSVVGPTGTETIEATVWSAAPPVKGKRAYWLADGTNYWIALASNMVAWVEPEQAVAA